MMPVNVEEIPRFRRIDSTRDQILWDAFSNEVCFVYKSLIQFGSSLEHQIPLESIFDAIVPLEKAFG